MLKRISRSSRANNQRRATNRSMRRRFTLENLEARRLMAVAVDDPGFPDQWALHNTGQGGGTPGADINAPQAWEMTTGTGRSVVAIADTGVDYSDPDLYMNIWLNEDEIPDEVADTLVDADRNGILSMRDLNAAENAGVVSDLNGNGYIDAGDLLDAASPFVDGIDTDGNGYADDLAGWNFKDNTRFAYEEGETHGTSVAKTFGAEGNNGIGRAGVNWNSQIMPVFYDYGNWVEMMEYIVDNDADVSNHSYGWTNPGDGWEDAVDHAELHGHIMVVIAHNQAVDLDDGQPMYPASFAQDNIISVASTGRDDELYETSSYGAVSVDLAASSTTGTSIAAPLVTGVVSLLRDLHPGWNAEQLIHHTLWATDQLPALQGLTVTGGRLNAAKALRPERLNLFSSRDAGQVIGTDGRGVQFAGMDILQMAAHQEDGQTGYRFGKFFDGGDVGLHSGENIDAFTVLDDGVLLMSFSSGTTLPDYMGLGNTATVGPADIVRFVPTSLGEATAGTWYPYFNGEDVGLAGENIDALHIKGNGDLIISLETGAELPGAGIVNDEDLLRFQPNYVGPFLQTQGTWSRYFDGSDVGLEVDGQKDIEALFIGRGNISNPSDVYFTTHDDTTIDGLFYETNDVVHFQSTKLGSDTQGSFANGSFTNGAWFGLPAIDGLHLQYEPPAGGGPYEGQAPGNVGGIYEVGDAGARTHFGIRVPIDEGPTVEIEKLEDLAGPKTVARVVQVKVAEIVPPPVQRYQAIDIVLRDEKAFAGRQLPDLIELLGERTT